MFHRTDVLKVRQSLPFFPSNAGHHQHFGQYLLQTYPVPQPMHRRGGFPWWFIRNEIPNCSLGKKCHERFHLTCRCCWLRFCFIFSVTITTPVSCSDISIQSIFQCIYIYRVLKLWKPNGQLDIRFRDVFAPFWTPSSFHLKLLIFVSVCGIGRGLL